MLLVFRHFGYWISWMYWMYWMCWMYWVLVFWILWCWVVLIPLSLLFLDDNWGNKIFFPIIFPMSNWSSLIVSVLLLSFIIFNVLGWIIFLLLSLTIISMIVIFCLRFYKDIFFWSFLFSNLALREKIMRNKWNFGFM